MNPQEYCNQICKQSGSNFVYATYFLNKESQAGLRAFYAFCHLVDDAVDEADNKDSAKQQLSFWRTELQLMYSGSPQHKVSKALAIHLKKLAIPKLYLEEIINGCEMDLSKNRYQDFAELEEYCYRVASCVGLVCLYFFNIKISEENIITATKLGKALQLTNIIRDIKSDLKRDRIYLPQEELQKYNLHKQDLQKATASAALLLLLQDQTRRAHTLFKEAFTGIPSNKTSRKKWLVPLLMGRSYLAILNKICASPLTVFEKKIKISKLNKLKIILQTLKECYL